MSHAKELLLHAGILAIGFAIFRFDKSVLLMLLGAVQACCGAAIIFRKRVPRIGRIESIAGLPAILIGAALLGASAWLIPHAASHLSAETLALVHWQR